METEITSWKPKYSSWTIAWPVLMAVFIFALNETISNVALVNIAGALSISMNESTWIITSYLMASGIAIALVGFMTKLLGRKKLFIACVILFTFSSFCCAISHSMAMIVISRFLQGIGGGALLPLGQAIILETFPPNERQKAMAIFGLVFIFAPVIGPILGGWITENWSWPWIFWIDIPLGIICTFWLHNILEDPPYARKQKNVNVDTMGIIFLSLWLISMQIVLDKGNDADWFGSTWICYLSTFSLICAIIFFVSQFKNKEPLLNLRILKDGTYFWGTFIQVILMAVFLASASLLLSMLQNLMGYTSYLSGLSMGARGCGNLIALFVYFIISQKLGDRRIAAIGLFFLGLGSWYFGMINLDINLNTIAVPNMFYGVGIFFSLTPLVPLSCATISNKELTNASSLQNLLKNTGGAIGTSISTTMISRFAQVHQMMMTGHLNFTNNAYMAKVAVLTEKFAQSTDIQTASNMANGEIYGELVKQAHLWGYVETFRWFEFATFLLIPLLLFIKKPKKAN
ncbi:MAG: DHA2 family efflux MFS transporter permease subunit [Clostridiaceae bacterium]|jgi:DHA2 family multidrug resistance protein|nr:DHA2 family efflux MFS transporter permease subunit [Clostridiaceae bacterium]